MQAFVANVAFLEDELLERRHRSFVDFTEEIFWKVDA
jgi:hypothetical protein